MVWLRVLRWLKYYTIINGFIYSIGYASHQTLSSVQHGFASIVALYGAVLFRILCVVFWFDWIATLKPRLHGEKRSKIPVEQQRIIYYRIFYLVVPIECALCWYVKSRAKVPINTSSLLEYIMFIPKSFIFELAFDLFHYVTHWMCHYITWLYQHVHKRHHWHLHPCALSTYEQDGIDLCLTNAFPFIMAMRFSPSFSMFQIQLLFAYKTYVEVAGHSGLEIKGFSFPQMPLINYVLSTEICLHVYDHDLHHTFPKFNFAKRFTVWDKLFHTFRSHDSSLQDLDMYKRKVV